MTGRATHRGRTKLVQEQGAPQERFARAACSESSCPPHQPPSPPSPGQMSLVYLPDVIQMQDVDNFHLLFLLLFTILFIFSPPPGYARCHLHTSALLRVIQNKHFGFNLFNAPAERTNEIQF